MAIDSPALSSSSSRRNILAAAAGAAAAAVATLIGRPLAARAAHDGAMLVGHPHDATTTTSLATGTADVAFTVQNTKTTPTASGGAPIALLGSAGAGFGIFGASETVTGVRGTSDSGRGVEGFAFTNKSGVEGTSTSGPGVRGNSGSGTGVHGYSSSGTGVQGSSGTGYGVLAQAATGTAIRGTATGGTGGSFAATTGTALRAEGRVRFSSSGHAIIAAGTRSVTVTPGIDLVATSRILCTLEGDPGGATTLQRVAKDIVANTFQVFLTADSIRNVRIAWFVIG